MSLHNTDSDEENVREYQRLVRDVDLINEAEYLDSCRRARKSESASASSLCAAPGGIPLCDIPPTRLVHPLHSPDHLSPTNILDRVKAEITLAPHAASGTFVRQAKAQRPKLTRKQRRAKAAAKAKIMLNEQDMFESTRPPATTTSDEEEEQQPPPPANSGLMFISCSWHAYCNSCGKGYVKKDPSKVLEDRKCPQCQSQMVFLDDYLNKSPACMD